MPRIVFELEVDAPATQIAEALTTEPGIAGWWTDDVRLAGSAGATITLGFTIAPRPFQLRVDKADEQHVVWTSVGEFPPHWAGTQVAWTLQPAGQQVRLDASTSANGAVRLRTATRIATLAGAPGR